MAEQRASLGGSVLQQLPREGGGGGSLLYSSHLGVQPLPGPGRRGDGEGGGADGVELSLQDFQSSGDGTNSGSEDGDSRGGGSCGHEEGDTRRARRILANRRSAQRSRTRRMQYIHEIERKVDKMRTESEAMAARLVQLRMHHQDLDHRKVELKNNVATLMARSQQREASCNQLQCEIAHLRSQLTGTSLRNPGGQGPPSQIATLPPTGGLLPGMLQAPFSKGGLGEAVGVDRGAADVQPSLLPAMRTGGLDLQRGPPYLDSGINMFPGGIPSQAVAVDTHEVDLPHNRPNRMMFAPMAGLGQGAHPGGGDAGLAAFGVGPMAGCQPFHDIEDAYFHDKPMDESVTDLLMGEVMGQEPLNLTDLWGVPDVEVLPGHGEAGGGRNGGIGMLPQGGEDGIGMGQGPYMMAAGPGELVENVGGGASRPLSSGVEMMGGMGGQQGRGTIGA